MKSMDPDPRLTFESFIVGPANRLAAAAARRAAESPGKSFNPLFLYSASGMGKSHILSAIAQKAGHNHEERRVVYQMLEGYLEELAQGLQGRDPGAARDRYLELDLLLLDDVQFLVGQAQAQEMLLTMLDALTEKGAQVVLASDRPPAEIDDLDSRLLARFSSGLIVDIGQPDYETRVAIVRRKGEERGAELGKGVAEVMSRHPFRNVRELEGALNRLLAVQDVEERVVSADEVPVVIGVSETAATPEAAEAEPSGLDLEFDDSFSLDSTPEEPWMVALREVAEEAEAEGLEARRLRELLKASTEPEGWVAELERFQKEVRRAAEIRKALEILGNPWPEKADELLKDPDRLNEAESLLVSAEERTRPFSPLPAGPALSELKDDYPALAIRSAERLVLGDRPDFNPLFVHSEEAARIGAFLTAAGRAYLEAHPGGQVARISVPEFAEEFIRAISEGVSEAWRERWSVVDVLLVHGLEELSQTERAQDEFFHLFEALKRGGARIVLAADRAPADVKGVNDRLRSRFEGGLVVDLGAGSGQPEATPATNEVQAEAWFPARESVVWNWPRVEDFIAEDEE